MPRHPLPRLWLMTDERQGDGLWTALERLPRGAGVVFRHYRLEGRERRALFSRVRAVARRRRLVLVLAGSAREAVAWKADGAHGPHAFPRTVRPLLRTISVHRGRELERAARLGVDALFLSPVFPTRSHPGAAALGPVRFGLLVRRTGLPIIALGGMNRRKARHLSSLGSTGWAAIDAWTAGPS